MKRELWHISAHIISFHVAFRMTNVCPIRVFNNLIINNIKFFKTILLEGQKSVDILLLETKISCSDAAEIITLQTLNH